MKTILLVALLSATIFGCTKNSTLKTVLISQFTPLSATETQLLGTWYLKQQVIIKGGATTTHKGYDSTHMITFYFGWGQPFLTERDSTADFRYFNSTWLPNTPQAPNVYQQTPEYGMHILPKGYKDTIDLVVGRNGSYWDYDNSEHFQVSGINCTATLIDSVFTVTWTDGGTTIISTLHN